MKGKLGCDDDQDASTSRNPSSTLARSGVGSTALMYLMIAGFLFPIMHLFFPFSSQSIVNVACWSLAQWIPYSESLRNSMQQGVWRYWEQTYSLPSLTHLEIPVVDAQQLQSTGLLDYLEATYGKDWRKRPLLIRNLWRRDQLQDESRQLSLRGLLRNNQIIPYYTDTRKKGALTPDDRGRVRDIVANITHGAPHKIASQLLVQNNPNLIHEVAPPHIVEDLFGNVFHPRDVVPWGPGRILPALTTVPVFVAGTGTPDAHTGLHCEPIGNVAVQLSGRKQWTLVPPEFSHLLRPGLARDGRAFYASMSEDYSHVPAYHAVTGPGDAIWVPVWTWHRVDYAIESTDLAIGGSLFHFRPIDFVLNNPLFALLIIPCLVQEMIGINTQ